MITIEFGSLELDGCEKLEEIKALHKLRLIKKPIRINKNIASKLLTLDLIKINSSDSKYTTYALTKKGEEVEYTCDQVNATLESYLRIKDIRKYIQKLHGKRKVLFKIMITTCFSCGKEFKRYELEHIQDIDHNDGMYCKDCLKRGYDYALAQMRKRTNVINGSENQRGSE